MKLGIGMPIADTVPGECFAHHGSLLIEATKLLMKESLGNSIILCAPTGFSPHDFARNEIMKMIIHSECDRLFFMDDDTITPSGGLSKLMATMDSRPGCAAVSGFYLRRGYPYTPVWALKKDGQNYGLDVDGGVHEITMTGLGCCLIDVNWIRANVPQPWFKMDQNDTHTEITDDVAFFRAITKAGGVILGDADVQCVHIGRREWITRQTATSLRGYARDLDLQMRGSTEMQK